MQLRALKQIEVQTAEEVLREKARAVAQADGGALPRVRVTLGSHVFAGVPARIEERRSEPWLVLVDRDEVAYVPLRSITSVVVEHFEAPVAAEPASRLALERTRKELEANAGWSVALAIEWPAQTSEDDRRSIAALLEALRKILATLTSDELGRQAVAGVKRITLVPRAGRELSVTRHDTSLAITVGMAADLRDLQTLLEKHL